MSPAATFDCRVDDVGNIIEFGHIDLRVPDQHLATLFYVTGLGLTGDPFLRVDIENMWMNVGASQLHRPTGPAQVLRGRTGWSCLIWTRSRHDSVGARLAGTALLSNCIARPAPGARSTHITCRSP